MSNNEVKRQHYVPRTYLKHFSHERSGEYFIKAVQKEICQPDKMLELNVTNVCLQKDLYTLPGNTAEERMLLERFYSDNFETHYNQIYKILINPDKKVLTDSERELIISTVVTMLYRTTKWINLHNELTDRALESIFLLCQQTGKDFYIFENEKISIKGKTLEQLKKENKSESRPAQVLTQLKVALRLIKLRTERDGIFVSKLVDGKSEFITSDNPVIFSNSKKGHVAPFDPENTLKLPLDSQHLLMLMPYAEEDTKHNIVRRNSSGIMCFTEKLTSNYQQFCNSERFILGSENALLGYLATKEVSEKPLSAEEASGINSHESYLKKLKDLGLI
ncbi:DUF4238 domain-containing protein [Pontibacter virosus]|uniref:Uncharacterized protein DUF4238 n=1 Tax=Pontibacter virosus TaxID=1765052 RepID=A0A2U1AST0_9BACT|nr:DUF4238 domain-containing protein [Pontibacter virosus]PVY39489.1 uncharacterized protein DUF4238 [Pontibacter virosus]